MQVSNYEPYNRNKVIAYDVMTSSYEDVQRIARFADKADADKFRDAYNHDLRSGLILRNLHLTIEEARDILRDRAAYVSPVHEIPVVQSGGTLSAHKYDADYGWYHNQAIDASQE